MGQKPLSDAQLKAAADALTQTGGNAIAAAALLGMNDRTFQHHVRAVKAKGLIDLAALRDSKPKVSAHLPVTVDEAWEQIDGWIGRKRAPKPSHPKWKATKTQRIAVAGDFHAPFQSNDVVASLIAEEGPRTDTLVISGDLIDHYSISRFVPFERVAIEQEIAGADALLGQLAAAFPDVLIVEGNHDKPRFEKQIRSLLTPDMMHCVELLTGGNLSIVHMLAKRYKNVRFAPQIAGRYKLGWLTQVGDLVISHAEKFSRVPGAALRQIDEGLTDFDQVYGLKPWRVLIQAHTHQLGMFPFKSDRLLVEGGCCCETHGYQMTARMGGRPQRQGYVTLVQQSGVTDVNSVRLHWLNAESKVA